MEQKSAKFKLILGIALVVACVYLFSFGIVAYHYPTYEKFILKYSLNKEIAQKQTKNVIDYFQGKIDISELNGFDAKEAMHLYDVKWVIRALLVLMLVCFITLLFIADRRVVLYGGVASLVFPLVLYLVPFEILFDLFHRITFSSGTWLFDSNSLLIQMYPFEFFYEFFLNIIVRGIILSLIVLILAIVERFRKT